MAVPLPPRRSAALGARASGDSPGDSGEPGAAKDAMDVDASRSKLVSRSWRRRLLLPPGVGAGVGDGARGVLAGSPTGGRVACGAGVDVCCCCAAAAGLNRAGAVDTGGGGWAAVPEVAADRPDVRRTSTGAGPSMLPAPAAALFLAAPSSASLSACV